MGKNEKVAVFDFCETLVSFQTADAFVFYVRENYGTKRMIYKEKLRLLLMKFRIIHFVSFFFPHTSLHKRLVLWQLRGFNKRDLEKYAQEYYENTIKPNFIQVVINKLLQLQNNGWRILIVSGGYDIYINYFALDYNIPQSDVIAVKIKYIREKCKGLFDGGDRVWDKVQILDKLFHKDKIESIAFSDSPTDIPLLMWANKGIVVRRSDKPKWDIKKQFDELIWIKEEV